MNAPGSDPPTLASDLSWDAAALSAALRSSGYDVEPPRPGDPPWSSIVARRDLEDRGILLTVDRGGRFRIEITWLVGEWPSRQEISGIPVRVVDSVTRAVNLSGQLDEPMRLLDLVAGLGAIVSWASPASGDEVPPGIGPLPECEPPP